MSTEYLAAEELQRLLSSVSAQRDRLLIQFLYESGCTISEAAELKSSAVHADGTVRFSDRTAVISSELAQALIEQAGSCIFHTRQAPNMSCKRIQQLLKPYISAVHKGKTTPHILRYTHIVHAYKQGLQLSAIAAQTGLTPVRLAQIVAGLPSTKGYSAFFKQKGGRV